MQDPADRRTLGWLLIGLAVWVLTVPVLTALTRSAAMAFTVTAVWLLLPVTYAAVAKDPEGIGLTLDHLGPALVDTLLLTVFYSVLRIGVIVLFPAVASEVAGNAPEVAGALREVQFGTWTAPPARTFVMTFGIAFVVAAGNELFYRGYLFTRICRSTHWIVAVLASAALFGGYHYLIGGPAALAMAIAVSLIAGWLMARYRNVLAPILFHYLQYVTIVLTYYLLG